MNKDIVNSAPILAVSSPPPRPSSPPIGDSAENAFLPRVAQFLQQCNIYANQHYIRKSAPQLTAPTPAPKQQSITLKANE